MTVGEAERAYEMYKEERPGPEDSELMTRLNLDPELE